ncbi:MAG: hypothetical protein ACJ72L_13695 [Marmoricola sp.]
MTQQVQVTWRGSSTEVLDDVAERAVQDAQSLCSSIAELERFVLAMANILEDADQQMARGLST